MPSVTSVSAWTDLGKLRNESTRAEMIAQGKRLKEAAQVIADETENITRTFSRRIPLSVRVRGGARGVRIVAGGDEAPNAYPFETGARHPLFAVGPRGTGRWQWWYPQPHRPYLEEAARAKLEEAAEKFAEVIDDWAKELGFN
jgi:hypothetical protein